MGSRDTKMAGCWDNDFMFDVPLLVNPSTACNRLRQCESANEDWDLELSFGEKPPEAIILRDEFYGKTTNEDEYAPAPVASLLEYLNRYSGEASASAKPCVLYPLPRQPTLFSSYVNYQRQKGKSFGEIVNKHQPLQACPRVLANSSFLVPQAPESAVDVVAWLQGTCDNICHTSVVVARPSPEHVGVYIERERPPSKEIGLERALRAAEMAYCNGSWHASSAQTKSLLYRLEKRAIARGAAHKVVSLGGRLRRATMDEDLRCYQSCGRLARLLCRLAQCCDDSCAAGRLKAAPYRNAQFDRCEPIWPMRLDARDVAAFRCGTADLVDDIDDYVLQVKSKLIIDESVIHLALVHMRSAPRPVCEQMRPEDITRANEISLLFCGAIPPLPRSGIAKALDVAHSLRKDLRSQAANEIEASVLADLRLEAMGYSPLTAERLAPGEPPDGSGSSVVWRDTSKSLWNSKLQQRQENVSSRTTFEDTFVCESSAVLESALEGEWSLNASGRIEGHLINLVSALPPSSLARAKTSLALGLSHLRGVERRRGHKVRRELFLRSDQEIPERRRRGRKKALHATQELRIAEMLLFEATCVLEQQITTQPVDLPLHALRQHPLDVASGRSRAATAYSVLACSMGYTALRGLAHAFERRAKHVYAALVLDVCVTIQRLRNDANERRK
jgi:hypothetical protein